MVRKYVNGGTNVSGLCERSVPNLHDRTNTPAWPLDGMLIIIYEPYATAGHLAILCANVWCDHRWRPTSPLFFVYFGLGIIGQHAFTALSFGLASRGQGAQRESASRRTESRRGWVYCWLAHDGTWPSTMYAACCEGLRESVSLPPPCLSAGTIVLQPVFWQEGLALPWRWTSAFGMHGMHIGSRSASTRSYIGFCCGRGRCWELLGAF